MFCVISQRETPSRSEFSQTDVQDGGNVTSILSAHISQNSVPNLERPN